MVNRTFLGQFRDLNSFDSTIARLGIPNKINQMSRGSLSSRLMAVNLGPLQLLQIDFNQAMVIRGSKPAGYFLFAMTMAQGGKMLKSHGRDTSPNCLYGVNPNYDIYLLTPPRYQFAVLSVGQDYFLQFLQRIGLASLGDRLQHQNWLQVDPDRFDPLKAYVQEIFQVIAHHPHFLRDGEACRHQLIMDNVLPLLAECLTREESRLKAFEAGDSRVLLVKQAELLIEENLDKPVTLTDLYQALHTSRRTLIYAFNDVVGMTPIAYVKMLRLNAIRRRLLTAEPGITQVYQIANQYGFWSPGHFARDYRTLFGESPSQTLNSQ